MNSKNNKRIAFALFLFCVLAVSAFSQNAVSVDTGLKNAVKYFEERLPQGTKLVIMNIDAPAPALSEYVAEELAGHFVNSGVFMNNVYSRSDLALVQQEMDFQLSGEVSEETAREVGKKVGAQIIISGRINPAGDVFRLRIQAVEVETLAIRGNFSVNIVRDRYLTGLLNTAPGPASSGSSPPPSTGSPSPGASGGSGGSGRVRLPDYLLNN